MTPPQQAATTTKDEAGQLARTTADQASAVAGTAAAATSDVAGTAKEQAANVIGEGIDQAKDLLGTVRTQVSEQVDSQTERLTGQIRTLSTQLSEGDTSGLVGQVLQDVGSRLEKVAFYVERTGPQGLAADVRSYAKRNPGTFLLGAALAGLVTGRIAKGISAGKDAESATPALGGTAAGDPLAGVTAPPTTGIDAGYAPAPMPGTSYNPEPAVAPAYPTAPDGPAPLRYDTPTYGTPSYGNPGGLQ